MNPQHEPSRFRDAKRGHHRYVRCDDRVVLRAVDSAVDRYGHKAVHLCGGGNKDLWAQEREQWHFGANFFVLAPGQVVGYSRNLYTMEAMSDNGFEIIPAEAIVAGHRQLRDAGRCAIVFDGSELPHGSGGAHCMTMTIRRIPVNW